MQQEEVTHNFICDRLINEHTHAKLCPILVAAAASNLDVMGGSHGGRFVEMDNMMAGKKAVKLLQLHMGGFPRLRGAAGCLVFRCPSASRVFNRF